jgi:3-dehydroquinate synthase
MKSPASQATPAVVRVKAGAQRYDVLIGNGLLAQAADLISERLGPAKCAIVTDANVAKRHLQPLEARLVEAGRHAGTQVLEPGEATKSFAALTGLCERLLETGLERGGLVIALGGGVIGDLAGLAASLVRRGVRLVQIPTTMLAQVDSSIGGKTGINTPQGKNLVGTFHQPSLVLADIGLLSTLPPREFRSGYVEAAKYGLLGDGAYFAWLEQNWPRVFACDQLALAHAVGVAVQGKADVVARDETETGDRMLLNLGHTFGHALEAWTGYSQRLLHGEAVSIGICLAYQLSSELGFTDDGTVQRVVAHLKAVGLPTRVAEVPGSETADAATLVKIMGQDKKVKDGGLTLILARGIGSAFVTRDVTADAVRDFLAHRLVAEARS